MKAPKDKRPSLHTCPDCHKEKTRYEVRIKTEVKEYWVCWCCYDARKEDNQSKQWRKANRRSRVKLAEMKGEIYA